jgi:hypothetical protein
MLSFVALDASSGSIITSLTSNSRAFLSGGEGHEVASLPSQLAFEHVEPPAFEDENLAGIPGEHRRSRCGARTCPAYDSPHARKDLSQFEWLGDVVVRPGPDAGLVIDDQDMERVSHPRAGIEPYPGEKRACSTCHKASHFTSFRHQKPRLLASTGDMASLNLVLAGPIRSANLPIRF